MAAPHGNEYGTKLKDPDIRQEAFKQYCAHLASGYPKEAFFFDHPTHSVCWKTMDRYIAESPEEFPTLLIDKAKAARYRYWLNEGKTLMKGGYKNGSPVVWQNCMRNIFKAEGWDREQIAQDNKTHVERLGQRLRNETEPDSEVRNSELEQEN